MTDTINTVANINADEDRSSFYAQPAYTKLSTNDACEILKQYTTKSYSSHRQLNGGLGNSNYCIVAEDENYLCKICDEKEEEEVIVQLKALVEFQKHQLPISYPIRMITNNDDVNTFRPSDYILHLPTITPPIVLYEWKYGMVPVYSKLTSESYASLATAIATIHAINVKNFTYLPSFPMGLAQILPFLYNELPTLSVEIQQHPFIPLLKTEVEHICHQLYKQSPNETLATRAFDCSKIVNNDIEFNDKSMHTLPLAAMHGDLFLENTLFLNNEVDAIIDWEELSLGERALDVAMTIVGTCYDSTDILCEWRAKAFINAYETIFPLTKLEKHYFQVFLRYALLATAFWRWRQFNIRVPTPSRENSYQQMITRMQAVDAKLIEHLFS